MNPDPIYFHRYQNPFQILRLLAAGKSLVRSLFCLAIRHYKVHGKVLDLGSKEGTSSYYQFLQQEEGTEVIFTDLVSAPNVLQLNVEEGFPIPDQTYDQVLAFHLLEHVYDFHRLPSEAFRILKPGGKILVSVPFLHEYHADPSDFWRMSHEAVKRLFEDAGFQTCSIELLGEGILSFALTKTAGMVLPKSLRKFGVALAYLLAFPVDRLVSFLQRKLGINPASHRFALDVLAEFQKKV